MTTRVSSPRLIGRTTELDLLVTAFKAAATEERAADLPVGGEAGVGKTRLVGELAANVEAAGGLVASGTCLELVDRAMPFGPVVQALRDVHRRLDPDTQARWSATREPALARLLPELDRGTTTTSTTARPCSNTCSARCSASATVVPTLLVLEDLHWADHSTRDFLVFLAAQPARRARASSSARSAPTTSTAAIRSGRCSPSSTVRVPRTASISRASTVTRSPS